MLVRRRHPRSRFPLPGGSDAPFTAEPVLFGMTDEPGLSDQYRMASPWPLFVALGITLSEVGIIIGIFAVAVGGLLLLAGSVAGILKESGYVERLWGSLLAFGVVLVAAGGALVASQIGLEVGAALDIIATPGAYGQVV